MCHKHLNSSRSRSDFCLSGGLTRRRFLTRAIVAGMGLAVGPLLSASAKADGLFAMPKPEDQKKVGAQAAQQVLQQYHEINDSRARQFRSMGDQLVSTLSHQDQNIWDYKFHMLDSKEVNAFALPGGNVFMFTGLYNIMQSEDALAAVTGHEMTHVRKQHWAQAYAKQQERDTLLTLGLSFFHAGRTAQTVAGLADNAIGLRFSRGEEDQADAGGLENMTSSGYNPNGMVQMFQSLQQVAGNGAGLGGDFLSNHPLTSDRIKHAQQRIAELQQGRVSSGFTPLGETNHTSETNQR